MTRKVVHIITGLNDGGAESVLTRLCLPELISCQAIFCHGHSRTHTDKDFKELKKVIVLVRERL